MKQAPDALAFPSMDEQDVANRAHYHPIGIFFHWLMAALVIGQLWWGWRTSLLDPGIDKLDGYVLHAQLGAAILLAAFMRLGWRMIEPVVAPRMEFPEDLPKWQHTAAEFTHGALYVLMLALPISGLAMMGATAPETLVRALGFSPFTNLDMVSRATIEHWAELAHSTFVWAIMGFIALHVGAALKHYFVDRDDVLARMIPFLGDADDTPATRMASQANTDR